MPILAGVWVIDTVASAIGYFVALRWTANQRTAEVESGMLVSDERGQTTGTPIGVLLSLALVVTVVVGGKVAGGMGFDPVVGAGYTLALLAVIHLSIAADAGWSK